MKRLHLAIPGFTALALCACATDECLDNSSSLPYAGFYSSLPVPQKVAVSGLQVKGVGVPGDSILLKASDSGVNSVYLPFRLDSDETSYTFSYNAAENPESAPHDEVKFSYERVPWFVSSACGAVINFRIKSIEHTSLLIDSISCPTGIIDNANAENIRIYFKVMENEE